MEIYNFVETKRDGEIAEIRLNNTTANVLNYNGPQNSDSVISYTWEIKGGGPSGTNAKEVSAFI